jgi:hypothetical protein
MIKSMIALVRIAALHIRHSRVRLLIVAPLAALRADRLY